MRFAVLVVLVVGCASDLPADDQCVIERMVGGEVDARSVEVLDSEGRPISIVSHDHRTGLPSRENTAAFEYDALGRLVAVERSSGSDAWRWQAIYEADRILVRSDGGETIEYTLEDGRVVFEQHSIEGAAWDRSVRYAYDERGRLIEEEHQRVEDGRVTYQLLSRVLAFDALDRVVEGERAETREFGAVAVRKRYGWSYADEADGVAVTRTIDGRATIGRFQTDAMGRLRGGSIDDGADGVAEWLASFAYDDASRTMSAVLVLSRPTAEREWRFVARGHCPAPRLPQNGIRVSDPLPLAQGRVEVHLDSDELFGF